MIRILGLFLVTLIVPGCAGSLIPPPESSLQGETIGIQEVDASNGIDQNEAYLIAKTFYYSERLIGCGMALPPIDKGSYWLSETAVGYFAEPGTPIKIDKRDGTATWDESAHPLSLQRLKEIQSQFSSKH